MANILIVDDVATMREQYAYDLRRLGDHQTRAVESGEEALACLEKDTVDCMILDLEMPGMDGFDVLRELEKRKAFIPVIVYTGTGDYDRCVRAIRLGAYSFIDKTEPMERVAQEIENALAHSRLLFQVASLKEQLAEESQLVGVSDAIKQVRREIDRVAPIPSPVLITGESGTGKELVARDIHERSERAKNAFLAINCAALPENLVESELFGHEAGAFTGAGRARKGAFEAAHRGTLFLDEIGELPLGVQSKLLRVLEGNEVTRVGGTRSVPIDTRVVAATNRNLDHEAANGRFREDLFFRINVHQIHVPPLRERMDDIPVLVEHFLEVICQRLGPRPRPVTDGVVRRLCAYSWERNNVRELRNVVERLIIAAEGDVIDESALPPEIGAPAVAGPSPDGEAPRTLKELKKQAERGILLTALQRNDWQITRTAEELGLADHSSLLKIMRRHKIKRPR